MPFSVEVTLRDGAVAALLKQCAARTSNFRPVLRGSFHDEARTFFRRQFETEGAWGRMRWPPLSPVTLELRRRRGIAGDQPLTATGRFRRAFVEGGDVFGVQPHEYRLGSSWPIARLHQTGWQMASIFGRPFKTGPRQVPARPVIPHGGPDRSTVGAWERVLLAYLVKGRA